jgi:hypothetical protein
MGDKDVLGASGRVGGHRPSSPREKAIICMGRSVLDGLGNNEQAEASEVAGSNCSPSATSCVGGSAGLGDEKCRAVVLAAIPNLLSDIRALMPIIHRLGGETAVRGTFQAIQTVATWWP